MSAPSSRLTRIGLIAALMAVPAAALAYGIWIHSVVPVETLKDFKSPIAPAIRTQLVSSGVTDADVAAFRRWFYDRASAVQNASIHREWIKRYPTPASFDAQAFKTLLMMNPAAQVLGVDSFAAVYRTRAPADVALDPTTPYARPEGDGRDGARDGLGVSGHRPPEPGSPAPRARRAGGADDQG